MSVGELVSLNGGVHVLVDNETLVLDPRQVRLQWIDDEARRQEALAFQPLRVLGRPETVKRPRLSVVRAFPVRLVNKYQVLVDLKVPGRLPGEPQPIRVGDRCDYFFDCEWMGPATLKSMDKGMAVLLTEDENDVITLDARLIRRTQRPLRVYLSHAGEEWKVGDKVMVEYMRKEYAGEIVPQPPNSPQVYYGDRLLSVYYPGDGSTEHSVQEMRIMRRL